MLKLAFAPMALAQQSFPVGSTIRVTVGFSYTGEGTITLKAEPYYQNDDPLGASNLFTGPPYDHMIDSCVSNPPNTINLPLAGTPTSVTEMVDFPLLPYAQGGIDDGTYGLIVWVDGTNISANQDNVLVVTGNKAPSIWDTLSSMLPFLMMMLMMGMIIPMMQGNQD